MGRQMRGGPDSGARIQRSRIIYVEHTLRNKFLNSRFSVTAANFLSTCFSLTAHPPIWRRSKEFMSSRSHTDGIGGMERLGGGWVSGTRLPTCIYTGAKAHLYCAVTRITLPLLPTSCFLSI